MPKNIKCDPLSNNINLPLGPPLPGMPGFGLDINFGTPSLPGFNLPEDILDWLRRLKFNLPGGGVLQEMIDKLTDTVAKLLSGVLAYLNLFMGFLMFAMAIIEMILCIIKVLCAYPKPWSMIRAVKRLIRKCVPIFISICFPFLAWLLLLLSLIAILIALIEYIIMMIIRLIKQLIANLIRLKNLLFVQIAPNAALAIVAKLANLLCLFEQIFQFLGVIFALFEIITQQWTKILKVCGRGSANPDGSRGPDDDDVCSPFMRNTTEKWDNPSDVEIYKSQVGSANGKITYCNEVSGLSPSVLLLSSTIISTVRPETIYLQDDSLSDDLAFFNIIENGGFPFFPFDKKITKDIQYRLKPYFIDLFATCDPGDGNGSRKMQFEDVTVTNATLYMSDTVTDSVPSQIYDTKGYVTLSGGKVINDGYLNGYSLEYILGEGSKTASPKNNDISFTTGSFVAFTDITYNLKINFDALAEYNLITMGCYPSMQVEQAVMAADFAKIFNFALPDFVTLPDVGKAIDDLNQTMSDYRKNITPESTVVFGERMTTTMNDLNTQALNTYCQLLNAAIDPHNIDLSLDNDLQFTNIPIILQATPKDKANRGILELIGGFTPPQSCLDNLFTAEVTLGNISDFVYDGYGNFLANINSSIAGDGYATVYFNGDVVQQVIRPTDLAVQPSIIDFVLPYTFIGLGYGDGYTPAVRRDETDNSTR